MIPLKQDKIEKLLSFGAEGVFKMKVKNKVDKSNFKVYSEEYISKEIL